MNATLVVSTACLVIIFFIFIFRRLKNKKRFLSFQKEEDLLKASLQVDNHQLKSMVGSSNYLNEHFITRLIGKRLVAWGVFDDLIVLLKYKKGNLVLGVPTSFYTQEKYFNITADFRELEKQEENELLGVYGAENYLLYAVIDDPDAISIPEAIAEFRKTIIQRIADQQERIKVLERIEEYEALVGKSGEAYI